MSTTSKNLRERLPVGTRSATVDTLLQLAETAADRHGHQHPDRSEDLYCLNLTSYMGERLPFVLAYLADLHEQNETLRAERDQAHSLLQQHGISPESPSRPPAGPSAPGYRSPCPQAWTEGAPHLEGCPCVHCAMRQAAAEVLPPPYDFRPGDVWRDDALGTGQGLWHVRAAEAGGVELYEKGGPGLVPASDVGKIRGGMTCVHREPDIQDDDEDGQSGCPNCGADTPNNTLCAQPPAGAPAGVPSCTELAAEDQREAERTFAASPEWHDGQGPW